MDGESEVTAKTEASAGVSSSDLVNTRLVARLRPFNKNELQNSAKNIVQMSEDTVTVRDADKDTDHDFQMDACHWSHNSFTVNEHGVAVPDGPDSRFSGQEAMFNDIGKKMLEAAWQGKNTSALGYGVTGSGKTYSLLGSQSDPGLLYRCSKQLFAGMEKNPQNKYKVTLSMLEVYNNVVVDLLSKRANKLTIRQNKKGVYVENLTVLPMKSAGQTEELLMQGMQNRTTAATKMNSTSSRSHLVITVHFDQFITEEKGTRTRRRSRIRFVDMAGSERVQKSGATGQSLVEAKEINKSMSALFEVIGALSTYDVEGKRKFVPYRNSVLTRLLQDDLGGNCEMTLILALSPWDLPENLNTLRLAKRARQIVHKVSVNDLHVDIALENMKAEIAANEAKLLTAQSDQEKEEIQKVIAEHQMVIRKLEANWAEKDSEVKGVSWWSSLLPLKQREMETHPYLQNITEDSLLSGINKHIIHTGHILVGASESDEVKIQLTGLGIKPLHAIIENTGTSLTIAPCSERATVHVNGRIIHSPVELHHLDHIKLGTKLFIVIGFPDRRSSGEPNGDEHSYEKCLTEVAENHPLGSRFKAEKSGNTRQDTVNLVLLQEFRDLLPQVAQAKGMADALGKDIYFEVEMWRYKGDEKFYIHVFDRKLRMEWLWTKCEFEDRKLVMEELYENLLSTGQIPQMTPTKDPFYDAKTQDICLGCCKVSLHNLAYGLPVDDEVRAFGAKGQAKGCVRVTVTAVPAEGESAPEERSPGIHDPKDLLGKDLRLECAIPQFSDALWVAGHPQRGVYCKVTLPQDQVVTTEKVFGVVSGRFESTFPLTIGSVSRRDLSQLVARPLYLELWGTCNPSLASQSVENGGGQQSSQQNSDQNSQHSSRQSSADTMGTPEAGEGGLVMDLELAKDLRKFFTNVCSLQQRLQRLRKQAYKQSHSSKEGEVLAWGDCSAQAGGVEKGLDQCVQSLKASVKTAIQRAKQSSSSS